LRKYGSETPEEESEEMLTDGDKRRTRRTSLERINKLT